MHLIPKIIILLFSPYIIELIKPNEPVMLQFVWTNLMYATIINMQKTN